MNKIAAWIVVGLTGFLVGLVVSLPGGFARSAEDADQPAAVQAVVGTAFSYQGYLEDGASAAEGAYDFEFKLYDADAVGAQVGPTVTRGDVQVIHGLFTVDLDFGVSAFGSGARWLAISVRPGASGGLYTLLNPRQKLNPAPYAQALPNVFVDESVNFVGVGRNFRISGNEVFGVRYNGGANTYGGMYVETSHPQGWPFYGYATNGSFRAWTFYNGSSNDWFLYNAGIRLVVPNEGGLRIGPSADYSLVISNTTGSDGIRVLDTGDDSIQIGSPPDVANYGVYIPSPGVAVYGLWPNTADPSSNWALFTVDNIEAGNVLANAYTIVAKVTGSQSISAGDVVAVAGVADPIPGATDRLPQVLLADSANNGVIGVVNSRMVWQLAPGKEAESAYAMQSVNGPAQPGDYVSLVVMGVVEVKVEVGAMVQPGDRLTASTVPGAARSLGSQVINGMTVSEGVPIFGIALESPSDKKATIAVYITLR